jgi:hypothetical protein
MVIMYHGYDPVTAACCSDVFLLVSVPINFSTLIAVGTPVPQQSFNTALAPLGHQTTGRLASALNVIVSCMRRRS